MAPSSSVNTNPVLLIDTYLYKPPKEYVVQQEVVEKIWRENKVLSPEDIDFMLRVYARSGLGKENTYLPPSLNPAHCGSTQRTDMAAASAEAEEVLCGAMEGLLRKTGLQPRDIDILITTCSIYCPTPSMASMVVNRFNMRTDVQSYHLGGMGCSNGVVAINLLKDLLQARPNVNAVLLTTETVSPCYYPGLDKHRMVTNLLFRMGGAAVLLTNRRELASRAKYKLALNYRVHVGQSDDAYTAVNYSEDAEGIKGIYLGKNVITEASRALTHAMQRTAPYIMTWSQIGQWLRMEAQRRLATWQGKPAPPSYQPDFNQGVQHFLLHAGGAKVLDGLGKALRLSEHDLEPSRAVLHDYGNVSSSTTWYTLGWVESCRGVKAGDTVLQVGVGSGIKCGVNVWKAARDVDDAHDAWEERMTPARAAACQTAHRRYPPILVNAAHGALHVRFRLLFALIMLVCMAVLHVVMAVQRGDEWPHRVMHYLSKASRAGVSVASSSSPATYPESATTATIAEL